MQPLQTLPILQSFTKPYKSQQDITFSQSDTSALGIGQSPGPSAKPTSVFGQILRLSANGREKFDNSILKNVLILTTIVEYQVSTNSPTNRSTVPVIINVTLKVWFVIASSLRINIDIVFYNCHTQPLTR